MSICLQERTRRIRQPPARYKQDSPSASDGSNSPAVSHEFPGGQTRGRGSRRGGRGSRGRTSVSRTLEERSTSSDDVSVGVPARGARPGRSSSSVQRGRSRRPRRGSMTSHDIAGVETIRTNRVENITSLIDNMPETDVRALLLQVALKAPTLVLVQAYCENRQKIVWPYPQTCLQIGGSVTRTSVVAILVYQSIHMQYTI